MSEMTKREMFDALNEREKWILAKMVAASPRAFSSNDNNRIVPCLRFMCIEGILDADTVMRTEREFFTIKSDWRTWLADHSEELPDPHSDMPE